MDDLVEPLDNCGMFDDGDNKWLLIAIILGELRITSLCFYKNPVWKEQFLLLDGENGYH